MTITATTTTTPTTGNNNNNKTSLQDYALSKNNKTAAAAGGGGGGGGGGGRGGELDPNVIDKVLSNEFSKCSFQDRESISEEVHGVRCMAPEENIDMANASLWQLSKELDLICQSSSSNNNSNNNKNNNASSAYKRSQQLGQQSITGTYVNSIDFRLKFLRCELFNARKAAIRIISYLQLLMDLFDNKEELLIRPLNLSDLGKKEIAMMKIGNFQLLPYRDRSGRRILAAVSDLSLNQNFQLTMRFLMYFMCVAADSVESQRRGMVLLFYPSPDSMGFDGDSMFKTLPSPNDRKLADRFNVAIPIRICAVHLCLPDTLFFRLFRSAMVLSFQSSSRLRLKTHTGTRTELLYQLMGYGIPIDLLPISQTGNIKKTSLLHWIRLRGMIELQQQQQQMGGSIVPGFVSGIINDSTDDDPIDALSAIECPNLNDVIFRTGKSYMCHPGNVMFRSLIEAKLDEHFSSTRKEKAAIAWWIVEQVEVKNGRFLKWDQRGWWTEFEDRSEIRYKIPTYFRDFSRNVKARNLSAARKNHSISIDEDEDTKNTATTRIQQYDSDDARKRQKIDE